MTEHYFPFDEGAGANVTEAQWSELFKLLHPTGVFYGQDNEYEVYADSTGMQVKVKTGRAWVAGHYCKNDAEKTMAIEESDPDDDRIDRIILRVDWSANTLVLAVLKGVADPSPSAPALTQNSAVWEISLAQILVDAAVGTIAAGKVTDEREYGTHGVYTPTLTDVANLDSSTAYPCQWSRSGDVVTVSGRVDVDPTTIFTATTLGISLPIASNFANDYECGGTASHSANAGEVAAILADTANDRASMMWATGVTTNGGMWFSFTYRII